MRSLALLLALIPATALAVPTEVNHQGRLLDGVGVPLDGDQDLVFTLYDAASGGTSLWTESLTAVPFTNGYFSVDLGSSTPLDSTVFDGSTSYLAIAVAGGAELPTRIPIISVPYAIHADGATNVTGGTVEATSIVVNGVTVVDSAGSIPASAIQGGVGDDSFAALADSCALDQLIAHDGTTWACIDAGSLSIDAASQLVGTIPATNLQFGTGTGEIAHGDHGHSVDFADLTGTADPSQLPPTNPGIAQDCTEHLANGWTQDGFYYVDFGGDESTAGSPMQVYCDQTTDGGGWMRFEADTRRWGNNQGFGSDPISAFGTRVQGANSQDNLDNLTNCGGDSQVPMVWRTLGRVLSNGDIAAIDAIVTEGMVGDYHTYDSDGAADWDQIKGCGLAGTVVMTGDGDEFGQATNRTWQGPYEVDTFTNLFTTGYYAGNSDISGYNVAIPRYWYLR